MDYYYGEIRLFPYAANHLPTADGWAPCDGQLLNASDYQALYSIIGNTYGGNGSAGTFALPNLNGRVVLDIGTDKDNSITYSGGETGGQEFVSLKTNQMPEHKHEFKAVDDYEGFTPASEFLGNSTIQGNTTDINDYTTLIYTNSNSNLSYLGPEMLLTTGEGKAHENRMPYVTMIFCICLEGNMYPRRS